MVKVSNEMVFKISLVYLYINHNEKTGSEEEDYHGNGDEKVNQDRGKGQKEDPVLAPQAQGGRVTRAHPDGVRLPPGREGAMPSSASRNRKREEAAAAPKNTRGAPVVKLSPEATEAFKAHVEAMQLPLAKRVVAAVSAYPLGGKKDTSAKAVKEVSMLKEVRSMKGAAMMAGCSKSTFNKFVNRIIETVNGAVAAGEDAREVLARMTKALLEKKRGGARKGCTKLKPEHLETLRVLATALDTMTLTVKALRELLYRAYPGLRGSRLRRRHPGLPDLLHPQHTDRRQHWFP